MGESLLAAESVVLSREVPELASSLDDEELLEDLGRCNAGLYAFNPDDALN